MQITREILREELSYIKTEFMEELKEIRKEHSSLKVRVIQIETTHPLAQNGLNQSIQHMQQLFDSQLQHLNGMFESKMEAIMSMLNDDDSKPLITKRAGKTFLAWASAGFGFIAAVYNLGKFIDWLSRK